MAWRGQLLPKGLLRAARTATSTSIPPPAKKYDLGAVTANARGDYALPKPPIFQDWVVVLEG